MSSDGLLADKNELSFSITDWAETQTFNLNLIDDDVFTGSQDYSISLSFASDDINFNIDARDIFVVRADDDEEPELNDFIEGRIWNDVDRDGQQDDNEIGLSEIKVFLDTNSNKIFDVGERFELTNSQGFYSFKNVEIGTHVVGIADDFGWQYTFPSMTASTAVATSLSNSVENVEIASSSYFQDVSNSKYSLRPSLNDQFKDLMGSGQTVVVIDSGIDTDHPYFGDRIIYSKTFGTGLPNGEDIGGHGTHVSGIIASSDLNFSELLHKQIIALKVLIQRGQPFRKGATVVCCKCLSV